MHPLANGLGVPGRTPPSPQQARVRRCGVLGFGRAAQTLVRTLRDAHPVSRAVRGPRRSPASRRKQAPIAVIHDPHSAPDRHESSRPLQHCQISDPPARASYMEMCPLLQHRRLVILPTFRRSIKAYACLAVAALAGAPLVAPGTASAQSGALSQQDAYNQAVAFFESVDSKWTTPPGVGNTALKLSSAGLPLYANMVSSVEQARAEMTANQLTFETVTTSATALSYKTLRVFAFELTFSLIGETLIRTLESRCARQATTRGMLT